MLARVASKQLDQSLGSHDRLQTSNFDDGVITSVQLADAAVIASKLANQSVNFNALGDVSGNGMAGGAGARLTVFPTPSGGLLVNSSGVYGDNTILGFLAGSQTFTGPKTFTTSITLSGGATIGGVPNPLSNSQAANKGYVDSVAQGLTIKMAAQYATSAALLSNAYNNGSSGVGATLTATANGALSIDGSAVSNGDRVLIKDEVAQENNGIYTVTQAGTGSTPYILTRATDDDAPPRLAYGNYVFINNGITNADSSYVLTGSGVLVVGTSPLAWTLFATAAQVNAGNGLTKSGNTISVDLFSTNPGLKFVGTQLATKTDDAGITTGISGITPIYGVNTDIAALASARSAGVLPELASIDHAHPRDILTKERFTGISQIVGNPSTLTLTTAPIVSSGGLIMINLALNGLEQEQGAAKDYTISGLTITFNGTVALNTDDIFIATYWKLP